MPDRLFQLPARTQIEMTGSDRTKHLHSFCTNDIQGLSPGTGCEAFILNTKGKIIGHVHVFCGEKSIVLETVGDQAEDLIGHLDRYVIREDVQFMDRSNQWSELLLETEADSILNVDLPRDYLDHIETQFGGVNVSLRRVQLTSDQNFLVSCLNEDLDKVRTAILNSPDLDLLTEADFQQCRIEFGTPLFGIDISADNLPQELGRDQQSISFEKGCYLGQETIARIDALGHVNKLFSAILFEGSTGLQAGDELIADEKPVGKITSVCQSERLEGTLAIGFLKTKYLEPGTELLSGTQTGKVIRI